jgi:drug/metabolite transporter (DMT)-like permease
MPDYSKKTRIRALVGCAFGVLWLTPDSVLVRLYTCGVTTQLMYKNMWFSLMCIPLVALEQGGFRQGWVATKHTAWWLPIQASLFTCTQYSFTFSLTNTAAATTLVLLSSSPLFSSLLARVFLREELKYSTMLAMVGGAIGLGIVFVGNLSAKSASNVDAEAGTANASTTTNGSNSTESTEAAVANEALGISLGLCSAVFLATYLIVQRHTSKVRPGASEMAGLVLAGPMCCVVGFAVGAQHIDEPRDMLWAFVQGGLVGPIAFGSFAIAPRYLLASEVGLVMLLEMVLGPVWVFAAGFETPPQETIWGGLVLLVTLVVYFTYELCWEAPPRPHHDEKKRVADDQEGELLPAQLVGIKEGAAAAQESTIHFF